MISWGQQEDDKENIGWQKPMKGQEKAEAKSDTKDCQEILTKTQIPKLDYFDIS